jgi:STE24 endopeptidase
MKKELWAALVIIILVFLIFIFFVKYTEGISYKNITSSKDALKYQKDKVDLWILNLAWGGIIPFIFLFTGLSSNIRNFAQSHMKIFFISAFFYFAIYYALNFILSFPLEYYGGFFLKHSYGLSNQAFIKWFSDSIKGFLISALFGGFAFSVCFLIVRGSRDYWWLYVGMLTIPILFFVTFLSPLFIDPIFNKYESIGNPKMEAKINDELKAAGIEECKVFKVNKSVDTNEMNAYMTGVLSSKRIVLWDTTINNLSEAETLSVSAHETGHYVLGHVWKAILLGGVLNIIILFFINRTALWAIAKSNGVWGFNSLGDAASLPLLILIINLYVFIITPGINVYSRYTEKEADRFEIELTKDNKAAASSILKLHQGSLILPSPGIAYKLWNYSHPTLQERLDFANSYSPWKEGKPLKYEKYFRKR